jgi:hypothetical protein
MSTVNLCETPCSGTNGLTCERCNAGMIEKERERIMREGIGMVSMQMQSSWNFFIHRYLITKLDNDIRDIYEDFLQAMR